MTPRAIVIRPKETKPDGLSQATNIPQKIDETVIEEWMVSFTDFAVTPPFEPRQGQQEHEAIEEYVTDLAIRKYNFLIGQLQCGAIVAGYPQEMERQTPPPQIFFENLGRVDFRDRENISICGFGVLEVELKEFHSAYANILRGREELLFTDFLAWDRSRKGAVEINLSNGDGDVFGVAGLPLWINGRTEFSRLVIFVDFCYQAERVRRLLSARQSAYNGFQRDESERTSSQDLLDNTIILIREEPRDTPPMTIYGLDEFWGILGCDRRYIFKYERRLTEALDPILEVVQEFALHGAAKGRQEFIAFKERPDDPMSDFLIDSGWAKHLSLNEGEYAMSASPLVWRNWGVKPLGLRIIKKLLCDHLGIDFYITSAEPYLRA